MKASKSDHSLTNIYYYGSEKILVAVDCIIFGFDINEEKLKILLFKRLVEPFAGQWSLVGSFVHENEDISFAASRILHDLTGLENVFMEQLRCYGKAGRDPGSRVISIAYYSLIRIARKLQNLHEARWFDVTDMPELVLDHNQMVHDAQQQLQQKATRQPVGFNLLPEYLPCRSCLNSIRKSIRSPWMTGISAKKSSQWIYSSNPVKKTNQAPRKAHFFTNLTKGDIRTW